jgi:hypothetical protein
MSCAFAVYVIGYGWIDRRSDGPTVGKDQQKGLQAAQAERDLRALFLFHSEVLAADRNFFRDTVDDPLTDPIYTI